MNLQVPVFRTGHGLSQILRIICSLGSPARRHGFRNAARGMVWRRLQQRPLLLRQIEFGVRSYQVQLMTASFGVQDHRVWEALFTHDPLHRDQHARVAVPAKSAVMSTTAYWRSL